LNDARAATPRVINARRFMFVLLRATGYGLRANGPTGHPRKY